MYYDEKGNKLKDKEVQEILNHYFYDKKEEDTFICGSCGSDKVAELAYVNSNSFEFVQDLEQSTYPEHFYICYNEKCNEEFLEELTSYKEEK
tara:strand:+ start:374 stop:649 length:276 start_codon:yes stop_codon:yes gene_type:complete